MPSVPSPRSDNPRVWSRQSQARRFVTVAVAVGMTVALILLAVSSPLPVFIVLSGFLLWVMALGSFSGWRAEADLPGGVLRRWDRAFGILRYVRELPIGDVAIVQVSEKEDEGVLDWLKDMVLSIFSPDRGQVAEGKPSHQVQAECRDGTTFVLMEFADSWRALDAAQELATVIGKPLRVPDPTAHEPAGGAPARVRRRLLVDWRFTAIWLGLWVAVAGAGVLIHPHRGHEQDEFAAARQDANAFVLGPEAQDVIRQIDKARSTSRPLKEVILEERRRRAAASQSSQPTSSEGPEAPSSSAAGT